MRQRIEPEQLQELTPEQQERLCKWWSPTEGDLFVINNEVYHVEEYDMEKDHIWYYIYEHYEMNDNYTGVSRNNCPPLLSIGQCMALIEQKKPMRFNCEKVGVSYLALSINVLLSSGKAPLLPVGHSGDIEIIDELWQAVKQAL